MKIYKLAISINEGYETGFFEDIFNKVMDSSVGVSQNPQPGEHQPRDTSIDMADPEDKKQFIEGLARNVALYGEYMLRSISQEGLENDPIKSGQVYQEAVVGLAQTVNNYTVDTLGSPIIDDPRPLMPLITVILSNPDNLYTEILNSLLAVF